VRGRVLAVLVGAWLAGCGAKSQLTVPDYTLDAAVPEDAGVPIDCIELPFNEPPRELEVSFSAQIVSADVYFLVDVTGSMGEEIDQIRDRLREEIVPGLAAEIPDVRFSVGHFADFPLPDLNYGEGDDELFRLLQPSTENLSDVQRAVDLIPLQGGRDGPEAMVEALYLSATGEGFGRFAPAATCLPGTVAYPCFRPEGSRIFLLFSDAPSHNGPGGHDTYRGITPEPHTYVQAVSELRAIGAKVLGLYSGGDGGVGWNDLVTLARDTGATRADGTPIVFDIGRTGDLLGPSVVEAVRTLVQEVPIDVDMLVEDAPGDTFDATRFVVRIVADRAEPASGATIVGDRFEDVRPGTRVFFRIVLANELLPQTDVEQEFLLRVILRGDGITRLQENVVRVIVPPIGGGVFCPL
jgi:hypothetical protein